MCVGILGTTAIVGRFKVGQLKLLGLTDRP